MGSLKVVHTDMNLSPDSKEVVVDPRLERLQTWLQKVTGIASFNITPASEDASFRRYFRASFDGMTRIVMDAPPDKEDCRPFIHAAGLLRDAGVHAPEILAQDLVQGFLLLEDLGRATYLDVLNEENASELFRDAIDALIRWQLSTKSEQL